MAVDVAVVHEVDDELVEAFGRLLPQLSPSAGPLDHAALAAVVAWQGVLLLVARVDGRIVGALTLVTFPIPTGPRAWIEDVVVDETARGGGVGAALTGDPATGSRLPALKQHKSPRMGRVRSRPCSPS
ncbi:hypothetical protein Cme02nite_55990 [Catellatospora methionotrophica]|uniref:N-acetyltransferase domain-containing protein n=1 Tax=Catellatospora methionotrophica TaxID=121620 RepID=A0A8J3PHF2_9ACTN|nr:GNAT family N-acetyltransferase [Catellatospora methionotrophica]GIG17267.1 hypothetical protein Cme02nite_55990 [Catellatospora methionotrophica]